MDGKLDEAFEFNAENVSKIIPKDKVLSDDKSNVKITASATFAPFIHAFINAHGPNEHHLESFNELIKSEYGLKQILTQIFSIQKDIVPEKKDKAPPSENDSIEHIELSIKFVKVSYRKPTFALPNGALDLMTPQWARNNSRTYSSPIYVDIVIVTKAYMKDSTKDPIIRTSNLNNYQLATLPIMVRSILCTTHNISHAELIARQEDPRDPGGNFIIQGRDFSVNSVETITHNALHVHKNMAKDEFVRGIFISKPGDGFENSYQVTIRLHTNFMISVQFGSEPLTQLVIPFYMIYRMFGMTADMDIINTVTYCATSYLDTANVRQKGGFDSYELRNKMNDILAKSIYEAPVPRGTPLNKDKDFEPIKYNRVPSEIITFIAAKISPIKSKELTDNMIRFNNTEFLAKVDSYLFPHMGGSNERILKLRLLGQCIEILLKTHLNVMQPSDKDSYFNKHIFSPAFVTSKEFKRAFHNTVIKPLKTKMANTLKTQPYSSVDLVNVFQTAVKPTDLERAMIRAIQSGKNEVIIGQRAVVNRIMSQDITWKNQLFYISIMRTISPSGKPVSNTSQRAIDMRSVHTTTINSICFIQTPETGDKVGKPRQLAILARLSLSTSSEVLSRILLDDPDIYPLEMITEAQILEENMTRVFINGKWIGVTPVVTHDLAKKYRIKRRKGEIDLYTSIYVIVMTLDIHFSTEQGRIIFPLLVVEDTDHGQDILLTDKDLVGFAYGTTTIEQLEQRGVIDYIAPEEQDNCLIAEDYKTLRMNAHNELLRYTHCQIPQGLLGYTALSSPFGNYTDTVRVSYMTSHARQTCGWPTLNFGYRCERKLYVQTYVEYPLIQSVVTPHCYPNGTNMMIAYCPFEGYNQEDSAIVNASSCDRSMATITYYTYVDAILEKGQKIMNPDASNTQLIINANYSKIKNGLPEKNTIINRDDVVIGRVMETNKEGHGVKFIDQSVVYRMSEPAIVVDHLPEINSEGKTVHKIKLRACRRITPGDKVSSRYGNKSIASNLLPACELPVTVEGEIPDVIIDAQGISKRMLLGQINECVMSMLAAKIGAVIDGTTFSHIDHDALKIALEECGIKEWGFKRMIAGRTGEEYKALICLCSNYYFRLQKFVIDGMYAVCTGPTDALTRQPLRGKSIRGGLRLGEMEKDAFMAHGSMFAFREKFNNNSDGFTLYVCRNCGKTAIYNASKEIYYCKICENDVEIVALSSTWMVNIFNQQLGAAHFNIRYHLKPVTFYEQK